MSIRWRAPAGQSILWVVKPPVALVAGSSRDTRAVLRLDGGRALADLEVDAGLFAFGGRPDSGAQAVRESLGRALRAPGGEVFVAEEGGTIVAYLAVAPPGIEHSWGRLGDTRVRELSIEVARGRRGQGVARSLMNRAIGGPEAAGLVHVAACYAWCWDLAGTSLSLLQYSAMLMRLFEGFGFVREWTSDPHVSATPASFLAVRIGDAVPGETVLRFRLSMRGETALSPR